MRPRARSGGGGATMLRSARRCWPQAVTSCSSAKPRGSSTPSMRRPASCCGSSRREVATTVAQRPTVLTAGSTSPCPPDGAPGSKGSHPRCSEHHAETRSLYSHYRNKHNYKEVRAMQEWETPEFEEIETQ